MTASQEISVVVGRAVSVPGDDVDTDRIIPARYLRAITFDGMEAHVFEDDRRAASAAGGVHPFDDPRSKGASVLLVRRNFGCGSSREHAPQAIQRWGILAIVGESFSDIFFGNSAVIGLPCVTAAAADIGQLATYLAQHPSAGIRVDLASMTCGSGDFRFAVSMPATVRDAFLSGAWDTTGMLLDRFDEVRALAASLPYIAGFR
jgi:3-isopropylmalate/(R)-2-methylmalate dehydratase small subunit